MKDRIKELRKSTGLSQTKFGERLGVTLSAVQKWEMGVAAPNNAAIVLICDKFGVNETWLRTGAGAMYASKTRAEEMAELVKSLMADRPESFRSALVTALLRFDPDGPEWEILERIYDSIAKEASLYEETEENKKAP